MTQPIRSAWCFVYGVLLPLGCGAAATAPSTAPSTATPSAVPATDAVVPPVAPAPTAASLGDGGSERDRRPDRAIVCGDQTCTKDKPTCAIQPMVAGEPRTCQPTCDPFDPVYGPVVCINCNEPGDCAAGENCVRDGTGQSCTKTFDQATEKIVCVADRDCDVASCVRAGGPQCIGSASPDDEGTCACDSP